MKKEKLDETVTMTEKLGANQKIGCSALWSVQSQPDMYLGISICIIQIQ